jgi:hypothetical protein
MSPTTTANLFEELDYRESDGIEVWLLWSRATNATVVFVADLKTNESFELTTEGRDPLELFQHPYAYRDRCGSPNGPSSSALTHSGSATT